MLSSLLISLLSTCTFANERLVFVPIKSCEVIDVRGEWCQWSRWSKCDPGTCTRLRNRLCACPEPSKWSPTTNCESEKPQNDFMQDGKFIKHTRYTRRTTTKQSDCVIPSIKGGIYYPDCFKLNRSQIKSFGLQKSTGAYYCLDDNKLLAECSTQNNRPAIYDMKEKDIGACEQWEELHHWSLSVEISATKSYILTFTIDDEFGQKCTYTKSHIHPICRTLLFYNEYSRSDYGRLTNLAVDIDNCRFACAIHQKCKAFEFVREVKCSLLLLSSQFNYTMIRRSIGSLVEIKPLFCNHSILDPSQQYPFQTAMQVLNSQVIISKPSQQQTN